ncbi:lipocalin family protein [Morganella morganii]
MSKVISDYSLRDDGAVTVISRSRDTNNNKQKESTGKVRFVNSADTGALQISFSGSFCGGYNLIKLDDNYSIHYNPLRRVFIGKIFVVTYHPRLPQMWLHKDYH